jgi:hypothetical protein
MRKKKPLLIGITIGVLARSVVKRVYKPFRNTVRTKIYIFALDFVQNFDANNS